MKQLTNFLYEAGQLKRTKRSGWWLININNPESVAEHSHRTAVIGYFLAKLEKADANKVLLMCTFHDLPETRVNDLTKVGRRYVLDFNKAEDMAFNEQMSALDQLGKEPMEVIDEYQKRESKEALVARDADLLECVLQAKEYIKIGYKDAQNWIDNTESQLSSESAKRLFIEINSTDPNDWWKSLKKIEK